VTAFVAGSAALPIGNYSPDFRISRLYRGIHFESDIAEGKAHGIRIAAHTLSFAQGDGTQ